MQMTIIRQGLYDFWIIFQLRRFLILHFSVFLVGSHIFWSIKKLLFHTSVLSKFHYILRMLNALVNIVFCLKKIWAACPYMLSEYLIWYVKMNRSMKKSCFQVIKTKRVKTFNIGYSSLFRMLDIPKVHSSALFQRFAIPKVHLSESEIRFFTPKVR